MRVYVCRCGERKNMNGTIRSEGKLYCTSCGERVVIVLRTDR